MLLRYLFSFFLLFTYVDASKYPITFAKMGTPLFKSIKPISKISDIDSLKVVSDDYIKFANTTMHTGLLIDASNDDFKKKEYLFKLRKLQKKYDKFLHQLHKNIDVSIKEKKYDKFFRLISYEFDGLLKGRALQRKSIEFYNSVKAKKRSKVLDKKIRHKKLIAMTQSEFHTKIVKSNYNSSSKKISTKNVYIFVKKYDKYIIIFAGNKNPFSITINIKGKYKNLSHGNVRQTFSITANSTKQYIKLYKQKGSYSYNFSYSWIMGSMDAVHDDSYIYRLPYARGSSHVVSQGFHGKSTHKGINSYAIDFVMDIGTKIYASRAGVVVDTKDDSNKVGYSKEFAKHGNFVTIEHKDGTFATYYHLRKGGAYVRVGDNINRGDIVGYSGNTGYSSGPHLHFQVYKVVNANSIKSIPIQFISHKGVISNPKKGIYYKAK
ncbi:M23 family metallopeptidase [Sulfurimonas sp.]|uniref:M23 family metallopeptidase n=1 Tax=Sulfurimonas sp. TaxID=2022749 RepID=UPI002B492FFB|nr:M23 family metallopeptidase [Sulfurimonas sp.]